MPDAMLMLDAEYSTAYNESQRPPLERAMSFPTKPAALNVLQTPFCGDLRSKKFFMLDAIPTDESEFMDPSGHCWCHHTQQPIGPDGQHAAPDLCGPGRNCYRSALAPLT
jgi:hypothetical protein